MYCQEGKEKEPTGTRNQNLQIKTKTNGFR